MTGEEASPPTPIDIKDRRYAVIVYGERAGKRCHFGELEVGDVADLFDPGGDFVSDGGSRRVRVMAPPELRPDGSWGLEIEDASAELPAVKEPLPDMRQVDAQELQEALLKASILGPTRALDLLRRVPELFRKRGWSRNDDLVAVACSAVACVKVGALGQVFKIPQSGRDHDRWKQLGLRADASRIVSILDLGRMLEP